MMSPETLFIVPCILQSLSGKYDVGDKERGFIAVFENVFVDYYGGSI